MSEPLLKSRTNLSNRAASAVFKSTYSHSSISSCWHPPVNRPRSDLFSTRKTKLGSYTRSPFACLARPSRGPLAKPSARFWKKTNLMQWLSSVVSSQIYILVRNKSQLTFYFRISIRKRSSWSTSSSLLTKGLIQGWLHSGECYSRVLKMPRRARPSLKP